MAYCGTAIERLTGLEPLIKKSKSKTLLDIGCADGLITYEFAKAGADYICGIDVNKVWRNAKMAKDSEIHVEITTLLIENVNTDEEIIENISKRIYLELGEDTPFHITRSFPNYKSRDHGINKSTSD